MLYFVREATGERVDLLAEKRYTVSSKSIDFPLLQSGRADKSISRTHAIISVQFSKEDSTLTYQSNTVTPARVICKDSSTYGTYINDGIQKKQKIEKDSDVVLSPGDKIRFGLQWNTFTLKNDQVIVLVSNQADKKSISTPVWQLCGYVQGEWNYEITPTHFCTENVKICPQLLSSICKNIPIVKPQFWLDMLKAAQEKTTKPKSEDYFPLISDPKISREALEHKERRERLFGKRTFIFTDIAEYYVLKDVVECAGGAASKWSCCTLPVENIFKSDEYVVVGGPGHYNMEETAREKTRNVAKLNKLKDIYGEKKRFIPSEEIGLAILKCDIDIFCNPLYKPPKLIRGRRSTQEESPVKILVPDTPDVLSPAEVKKETTAVVLETVESDFEFEEESFLTFRDQTTLASTSRTQPKRPANGRTQISPRAKVPRMETRPSRPTPNQISDDSEEEEPFVFNAETALSKNMAGSSRTVTEEVSQNSPVRTTQVRKRQRIESSSSEEEDPFANGGQVTERNDSDEDDPFGFQETSFTDKAKKAKTQNSPAKRRFAAPKPSTSFAAMNGHDDIDDFDLESNWIEVSRVKREIKTEDDSEVGSRVSRMNLDSDSARTNYSGSVSVIMPEMPGSQKCFRKTNHSCMARLPNIISFADMKKVCCLTGKPVEVNGL